MDQCGRAAEKTTTKCQTVHVKGLRGGKIEGAQQTH